MYPIYSISRDEAFEASDVRDDLDLAPSSRYTALPPIHMQGPDQGCRLPSGSSPDAGSRP